MVKLFLIKNKILLITIRNGLQILHRNIKNKNGERYP